MEKLLKLIRTGEYEKIEGWCTPEKAIRMAALVKPTDVCVELGVFGGRSLLPLCLASRNVVHGIDAWEKSASNEGENSPENDEWWSKIDYNKMYNYTRDLMGKNNCFNCKLHKMTSEKAVTLFEDESIDVLHQDSNHSEKISCIEIELYDKKIRKGGYWIFDDTNWETTRKAQNLIIEKGYKLIEEYDTWNIYQKQ